MFTKNAFTQTDAIADLIKGINEADYKAKMEALKGNQHKIDKNKNNKVDADDFKILRGEKKVNEEEQVEEATSVKIPTATGTRVLGHRYGNAAKTHRDSMADPFAIVKGPKDKDLGDLEKKMTKKEEIDPSVTTTDTLTGRVAGKSANPFLKAKVKLNVNEEEVEQVDEATMTHITLGKKVKNSDGGHDQDVHYKGKKIGSISSYTHRTGLRYGSQHDASGHSEAGSRSPEEAIDFVRTSHADHLKSMKEEVEQVDERTLTKGETAEKERIVKGMKKSLAGFKSRYGERAKEVMYATATKAAKKD